MHALAKPVRDGRSRSFPFCEKRMRLRAGEVAYFDEGSGPEALVFIHGLVADYTHFEHIAPSFAGQHRVIGVDMLGCGASEKRLDARHTIRGYAANVLELLGRLGVERATLVGHSAGGMVSTRAALMAPHAVERLVLLSSAGLRRYAPMASTFARVLFRKRWIEPSLVHLGLPILKQVLVADNHYTRKFIGDALDRPVQPASREMAKVFQDLVPELAEPTLLETAHRITQPLMVLWGEHDALVPSASARALAKARPDAMLVPLSSCGHMPMIERPAEVIRAMQSFLGKTARLAPRAIHARPVPTLPRSTPRRRAA